MYAVVRQYTGAAALMDEMARKRDSVEEVIGSVAGFVAYYAVRSGDGLATITVCDDQAGTEESTRRAAAWIKENLPGVSMSAPQITGGDVFVHTARTMTAAH
jgi:hypothetical protein